jgi:hypothetical protein
MFLITGLIWIFGLILIVVAISLIIEGLDSGDKKKVAGGAALGLGAAAGLKYWSDKQKERRKGLRAASEADTKPQRRS